MEPLPIEDNPWKIISGTEIYDNPWIKLTAYDVINPSGGKGIYGKVHFKNHAVGVVALDKNNELFLVGQYRFPLERYSWEIPEGGCPLKEAPLEAAKRELLEETGLVASHWVELLKMDLSNSVSDESATVYLATGLSQKEAAPEPTEKLRIIKRSFSEVFDYVMQGKITDSMSVAAILKLKALGYH